MLQLCGVAFILGGRGLRGGPACTCESLMAGHGGSNRPVSGVPRRPGLRAAAAAAASSSTAGSRRRWRSSAPTSTTRCGRRASCATIPACCSPRTARSSTRERRSSSAPATRRRTSCWPRACGSPVRPGCSSRPASLPYGASLAGGQEYTGDYEIPAGWHERRVRALIDARPDFLAIETQPRADEAAQIVSLVEDLDCWVTFTCRDGERTLPRRAHRGRGAPACSRRRSPPSASTAPRPSTSTSSSTVFVQCTELPLVAYPNAGRGCDADDETLARSGVRPGTATPESSAAAAASAPAL